MIDGIYSITFRGASDWGMGMLILHNSMIIGADSAGILYDGSYSGSEHFISIKMTMTVPPGTALVQGTLAKNSTYQIDFDEKIEKTYFENNQPVLLNLPPGPVNVIFKKLRSL